MSLHDQSRKSVFQQQARLKEASEELNARFDFTATASTQTRIDHHTLQALGTLRAVFDGSSSVLTDVSQHFSRAKDYNETRAATFRRFFAERIIAPARARELLLSVTARVFDIRGVPLPVRKKLLLMAEMRQFSVGECICKQGQSGDVWFVVLNGRVALSTTGDANKPTKLAELAPGDDFGELGVAKAMHTRALTATCVTRVQLLAVSRRLYQLHVKPHHACTGHADTKRFLRESPFLRMEPMPTLSRIARLLKKRSYKKGSVIIKQGTPRKTVLFFIIKGKCRVLRAVDGGYLAASRPPRDAPSHAVPRRAKQPTAPQHRKPRRKGVFFKAEKETATSIGEIDSLKSEATDDVSSLELRAHCIEDATTDSIAGHKSKKLHERKKAIFWNSRSKWEDPRIPRVGKTLGEKSVQTRKMCDCDSTQKLRSFVESSLLSLESSLTLEQKKLQTERRKGIAPQFLSTQVNNEFGQLHPRRVFIDIALLSSHEFFGEFFNSAIGGKYTPAFVDKGVGERQEKTELDARRIGLLGSLEAKEWALANTGSNNYDRKQDTPYEASQAESTDDENALVAQYTYSVVAASDVDCWEVDSYMFTRNLSDKTMQLLRLNDPAQLTTYDAVQALHRQNAWHGFRRETTRNALRQCLRGRVGHAETVSRATRDPYKAQFGTRTFLNYN
ncbi:MAG: hypothetical protein MHM6MM_002107 [Cercozoa sp. M6MM]